MVDLGVRLQIRSQTRGRSPLRTVNAPRRARGRHLLFPVISGSRPREPEVSQQSDRGCGDKGPGQPVAAVRGAFMEAVPGVRHNVVP